MEKVSNSCIWQIFIFVFWSQTLYQSNSYKCIVSICCTFIIDALGKYYYCSSLMAKLTFKCKFVRLKSWSCNDKVTLFNNKFGFYGSIVGLSTQIRHFISIYRRKELFQKWEERQKKEQDRVLRGKRKIIGKIGRKCENLTCLLNVWNV